MNFVSASENQGAFSNVWRLARNLARLRRRGECQIPRERRGEGSQREGRKGEFVNTLLPFKKYHCFVDYTNLWQSSR